ncbi:MAG: ribulokinase, partial [Deltaproteobacteria bacterium]|nr:ribulokinase [Deltaproteobacteria bacterium]
MAKYVIGLDYGTESARAVLVDVADGKTIASSLHTYDDGVIDEELPRSNVKLGANWALQNPSDWLHAVEKTIKDVLKESDADPTSVIGLGIDFTSCTILPTTEDGKPLCTLESFHERPNAWPKLWKHHAAQKQADKVNALASDNKLKWLPRYGGKISSEWVLPKAFQIAEEDPDIYKAAERIVEGADWVVWQITDRLVRNACGAGYKAIWHKGEGFPDKEYLQGLHPMLTDLYDKKMAGPIQAPGSLAGRLNEEWSRRLGLPSGLPVATPLIDAHSAVLGGGVGQPNVMFMIMGTSTCHMLMATKEVLVEGISGVVEDGIVPGLFGYEAGQAGVGD